ncbi:kinase-like protein [Pleomassaria siparia CBS 279.74]|uniref:EKC/KEOPS complex subunit BUD32 n=1 Tax=Pleomassaria siparia CBS 279.74 TaxID=1314801 RepID=A0A6G1KSH9_9PLEO|nr:kinase-like protein [Pleomassaria siparia CBS 279.74]
MKPPADHERGKFIGRGSEKRFETWKHKPSDHVFVVKIIKHENELPSEVDVLKRLPQHPSIIQFHVYHQQEPSPNSDSVLWEYCPLENMSSFCDELYKVNKAVFSEAFMWSFFSQLSNALAFLHEGFGAPRDSDFWNTIVHRDIRLYNILISTLGNKEDLSSIVIKLSDFGLAALYNPATARMADDLGTTATWPPEQTWENREATPAGDVWAVGSVIHELAHGFPPYTSWEAVSRQYLAEEKFPWGWGMLKQMSFFIAKAPRKAMPINVDITKQPPDPRRRRPCPKYTDGLNHCMMKALKMKMMERATAGSLRRSIEEGYAGFMFEELKLEKLNDRQGTQGDAGN